MIVIPLGTQAQRGLQYLVWSVCLFVKSHLTYGASVRPENAVTGQRKFSGICLKRLRSRVMPRTNIPTYPRSAFSQRSANGYPTMVNNIRPCPKRCLLMPLTRVVARTESNTLQQHARREQYPRTPIGTVVTKQCMRRGFALFY